MAVPTLSGRSFLSHPQGPYSIPKQRYIVPNSLIFPSKYYYVALLQVIRQQDYQDLLGLSVLLFLQVSPNIYLTNYYRVPLNLVYPYNALEDKLLLSFAGLYLFRSNTYYYLLFFGYNRVYIILASYNHRYYLSSLRYLGQSFSFLQRQALPNSEFRRYLIWLFPAKPQEDPKVLFMAALYYYSFGHLIYFLLYLQLEAFLQDRSLQRYYRFIQHHISSIYFFQYRISSVCLIFLSGGLFSYLYYLFFLQLVPFSLYSHSLYLINCVSN